MNHEKDFFISGYLMPPRTDEAFSDLKAAGLNHIYIDYTEREQVRSEAFSLCDRWGIGAIVMTCWSRHDQPSFARVTAGVAGHPSFVGVNGLDEPLYEELDGIEREYDAFQARFPDKASGASALRRISLPTARATVFWPNFPAQSSCAAERRVRHSGRAVRLSGPISARWEAAA